MKAFSTLLVSLSCLVQFGADEEDDEVAQRVFQHIAYRQYQSRMITRASAIAAISRSYKTTEEHVSLILEHASRHTELDQELMESLISYPCRLLAWLDIPDHEWQLVRENLRPSLWDIFHEFVPTPLYLQPSSDIIIVDGDEERSSVLNSHGWLAVPFTSLKKTECLDFLNKKLLMVPVDNPKDDDHGSSNSLPRVHSLEFSTAVQATTKALNDALESSMSNKLHSFVELHGRRCYMLEYFSSALIASLPQGQYSSSFPHADVQIYLEKTASFVKEKSLFGFNGTDLSRYPPDIDTMSLCTSVMLEQGMISSVQACWVLESILANVCSETGIVQVYFDKHRQRVDFTALANLVFLSYQLGKESNPVVMKQEHLLKTFLLGGGYRWGTKYYPSPEDFMLQYGRVLHRFGDRVPDASRLVQALKTALAERIGCVRSTPIDIAKRLLLSSLLGVENHMDRWMLVERQKRDRPWTAAPVYWLPTRKCFMYNEAVGLCFVLAALGLYSQEGY